MRFISDAQLAQDSLTGAHRSFDIDDDHAAINWATEGNSSSVSRAANTLFVRSMFYNSPRVPLIVCSDGRSLVLFDYARTITTNAGNLPITSPAQAKEDRRCVGFAFLSETPGSDFKADPQPAVMARANNTVNINVTFRLFLIAAIYAGAYEAMGWTFPEAV